MKTLYADAKLCVIQNGIFSEFFNIGRGCRQGDPVSPYLFNICVEIMGILIRQNNNIKGIHIVKEFCLFQYADDTILFLDGTEKSLKSALDLLFQFSKFSGLKPNIGKTKAIWIGSMAESEDTICNNYNLQWSNGEFTVLGIKFNSSLSQMTEANFDNKLSQIVKEINSWSKRQLTPFGKITIIKSLLLPKLAHLFISLPKPPEKWMKNLEQVFFKFIWNDKTDKISRSQIVQDYPDGGLKMVHLESYVKSLKVTWLRRILLSSPTSSLITIFNETCQCELSSLLQFGPEYPKQLAKKCNNLFWKELLNAFSEFLYIVLKNSNQQDHPLWFNSNISIENNPIFINSLYKKGYFMSQIYSIRMETFYHLKNLEQILVLLYHLPKCLA